LGVIVTFVVPYERPVSAWRWRGLRSCKEGRVEIPRRDIRNLSDVQILVELQPTDNPRDARVFLPAELSGSAAQPGTDYVAKFGGPVALQFETPNKAGGAVGTDTKAGVRTLKYRVAGHYTYVMFPED
jgi:hypothetical protein